MAIDQDVPGRGEPGPVIPSPKPNSFEMNNADLIFDDLHPKKTRSATSRVDVFEASSFMDDANIQLETLHRQVFALAKQSRARSAVPWNSIQRSRMQKAAIVEMEDDASLARFDIDITGNQVKALTGRHPGANRRQIADLMHRLRDADAIGVYARRQGLRIVDEINEQIADLIDKIEKRMVLVDHDDRMPRSKASQRRAHYLAVLDDRLDKSRRWNNELRTQNAALRQDIDGLNLERRTDLAMLARLGDAVVEQRVAIRTLLDGIQQAELGQNAALGELAPLETQHRAEAQTFAAGWARTAELDERHRALEQEIIRMKGEMYFGESGHTDPDDAAQDIMSRTAWRIGKDKAMLQAVTARHKQLQGLVQDLQRLTSTTNFDEIVARLERADSDQLVQYGTLQSLIVELAELQREMVKSTGSEPGKRPPSPRAIVIPDPEQLENEAVKLRGIFTSMTDMMIDMMERLRLSGVSLCSEAIRNGVMTVGVTAQNIESIVAGLEDDIITLLNRLGMPNKVGIDPGWKDPDNVEDTLCVMLPSLHQYIDDDDIDIR